MDATGVFNSWVTALMKASCCSFRRISRTRKMVLMHDAGDDHHQQQDAEDQQDAVLPVEQHPSDVQQQDDRDQPDAERDEERDRLPASGSDHASIVVAARRPRPRRDSLPAPGEDRAVGLGDHPIAFDTHLRAGKLKLDGAAVDSGPTSSQPGSLLGYALTE